VKERPIIFSGPMIQALLDGRKSQTRRIMKPNPGPIFNYKTCSPKPICPYGVPGDRLWVRETWRVGAWAEEDGLIAVDYKADNFARKEWLEVLADEIEEGEQFNRLWEQSCDDAAKSGLKFDEEGRWKWKPGESPCRWRSPLHMPRWASRITLEITDVRVQRLQEITEEDAEAEGAMAWWNGLSHAEQVNAYNGGRGPLAAFQMLWEKIHGPDAWDLNPWVWAISFRRVP
jgi:hypothetical protein